MGKTDPLGYYAALNVGPDASQEEIRMAYGFLKLAYQERRQRLDIGKIRAAYATLGDAKLRVRYDRGQLSVLRGFAQHLGSVRVLLALALVFLAVMAFVFGPALRAGLTSFSPGEELYWRANGEALGTVLAFEREHGFPNGIVAPAYHVEPADGQDARWFPARDLERHCSRR